MRPAAETTSQRQVRLAEIQRQVRAGTYETRERLSAAIDALLEEFDGQPDGASGLSALDFDEYAARRPRPK